MTSSRPTARARRPARFSRTQALLAGGRIPSGRDERALERDEAARRRDLAAQACDEAADARDRAARAARRKSKIDGGFAGALRELEELRASATGARKRSAADRAHAAQDREHAARDREQARVDLQRAHLDDLTGAYRRGMGELLLQHEINRSRRSDDPLVLAFVDVDELKYVNDTYGHAAGDALLCEVVAAIRSSLRSFDPVVRFGGDEFVCALSNATLEHARARFREIQAGLVEATGHGITVGFAELRPEDTLHDLKTRGDADLYEAKSARR